MVRAFAISLLAAATLTACASERDVGGYDEAEYELTEQDDVIGYYGETNIDVGQARTYGTMGPVSDISGLASASGYKDSDYTEVNVLVDNSQGSAMHMLYIEGDLGQLERDRTYSFGNEYEMDSPQNIYVASTNCAGPEPHAWDYDTGADQVDMTVRDGEHEGEVLVEYETISSDSLFGSDTSGGEFVLQQ